jgi:hypothetical protein
VPQQVDDRASTYQCITCYGQVRFFKCPECGFIQTVNERWEAFTCSSCEHKVDLPRRWGYDESTRAGRVQGTGHPYPRL